MGLRRATAGESRTLLYVERDPYAAAVLVARMEAEELDRAPIYDDLQTFDGRPLRGRVDIVSAGFPCPPYSTAGAQLGAADERDLWPEVLRIVRQVEPSFVFLENVRGFLRHPDGLPRTLADLSGLGFDAEWTTVRAGDLGAPHRRERIFVLARRISDPVRDPIRVEPERGQGSARSPEQGHPEPGILGENVPNSESPGLEERDPLHGARLGGSKRYGGGVEDRPSNWPSYWPPKNDPELWREIPLDLQPFVLGFEDALGDFRRMADGVSSELDDREDGRQLGLFE